MLDIGGKKYYEVFKAGKYPQVEITAADLKLIADNYDRNFHEAPVWIGHPIDEKGQPLTGEEPEALGWVESVIIQGDSLYVCFSFVSEDWIKLVQSEKYKYVSVELPIMDVKGKEMRYLYAIGLCNRPAVRGLRPIDFKDHAFNNTAKDFLKFTFPIFNQNKIMNEHLKKIAEMCGLHAADFADEPALAKAVTEKITGFKADVEDLKKKVKATDAAPGDDAKYTALESELQTLKKDRVLSLVDNAITAGKILPAQKEGMVKLAEANYDEAKSFIDKQPKNSLFNDNQVRDTNQSVNLSNPKFTDKNGKKYTYADVIKDVNLRASFTSDELAELKKLDPRFAGKNIPAPVVNKK